MDIRPIDASALQEELQWLKKQAGCANEDTYNDMMYRVCNAPTLSLNTLRDAIYQDAVEHGLWEYADRLAKNWSFDGEELVRKHLWNAAAQMVKTEARELTEVSVNDIYNCADNRASFTEELADVVIMCFSAAGKLGIDIDVAIRRKMEINKGRPWKHGKE